MVFLCRVLGISGRLRRGFSAESLEREASSHPSDAARQTRLYKELNRTGEETRVIRRIESRRFAVDDGGVREYLSALSRTGRLGTIGGDVRAHLMTLGGWGAGHPGIGPSNPVQANAWNFPGNPFSGNVFESSTQETPYSQVNGSSTNPPSGVPNYFRLDPSQGPLSVVVAESSRAQFWRFLKGVAGTLIIVSGLSVLAESLAGNIQKGLDQLGPGKKVEPVKNVSTTFSDVKGCEEVKDELKEIIEYLKNPNKFTRLGAKLPKGVLLAGPPGTGKTLIARAVAGESGVPFIQASGSEFEEMFVGVGARRVRDLFSAARKIAPCILFIDEIDAVGSKRHMKDTSSVRMTLNQLLVELDGFEQNEGVVVICATNFAESLDKALTRPGRLDKIVTVSPPDLLGRRAILDLYGSKLKLATSVDLSVLAKRTVGMTGADLSNILNIAAIKAASENLDSVTMDILEESFDRVVLGLERKTPISEEEKLMTAYHEAGHVLVGMALKGANPVQKATVIPRGSSLGVTYSAPETDKFSDKLFELEARLAVAMGGKVAEEVIYGNDNVSGGCASDLKQASNIARGMVMHYGMGASDVNKPSVLFLDAEEYSALSDKAKTEVDASVERLLRKAYETAKSIINDRSKELERLAEALVEFETLNKQEIELACSGGLAQLRKDKQSEFDRKATEKAANIARVEPITLLVKEKDLKGRT